MPRRIKKNSKPDTSFFDKLDSTTQSNQSKLSMVLGVLIVIVVGILVFNYFQKGKDNLGPAQQTQQQEDVSPDNLPGKYTVKEGDTLFLIAEKYYQDGNKFTEIAKANNLKDVNSIEKGQVLQIPKLSQEMAQTSPTPSESPSVSSSPSESPSPSPSPSVTPETSPSPVPSFQPETQSTGIGGGDTTIWGPTIHGDTYTVVEGDWLSKIAGRAYGDIFAFKKLAQANHIKNPDLIFPGQVLVIPR